MTKPCQTQPLDKLDELLQASLGHVTHGISPASFLLAYVDWLYHLSINPGKQTELFELLQEQSQHLITQYIKHLGGDPSGEYVPLTPPTDKRFVHKSWQKFPFSFMYENFLMIQNWWHVAATGVRGVSKHHEDVVDFSIRQFLDMISLSNSPFTNPEIQQAFLNSNGSNFINGMKNFLEDIDRYQKKLPPVGAEEFVVGETMAITPGKVIYRNRLIELIQYTPQTQEVYAEPVLITPAWIMKYYILDLAPKHSLVNFLVSKGHTVFMISWKNPEKKDAGLGMQDYLDLGIFSALDVINNIIPKEKIHLLGYCLGGTLAAIAAASMAANHDERLASLTLLAAQTDFSEPGELGLFIDDSQISFLENVMKEKGYLDTHEMAGAFQLLRSNDLIWSRMVREYFLGERQGLNDLMAWNADATRMPYKMHSEYLRNLFLNNLLAEGKYKIHGKRITLMKISAPIFVVGTERDHVSPWHSVFKINLLTKGEVTFALTSGGHNAGIVSLASKKNPPYFRISTLSADDRYLDADTWYTETKPQEGSWWPALEKWLVKQSDRKIPSPKIGSKQHPILEDAPGKYVLQK